MTILNNENDGLYPELIVLFRAVAYSKSISIDDLINCCSPASEKVDSAKRLKGSLLRWERLGLFNRDQEYIRISPEIFPHKVKQSTDSLTESLPTVARHLLMKEENCLPLWDDTSESEKGNGTSADFVRALSWVLTQDIYNFPKVWDGHGQVDNLASTQSLNEKKVFSSGFRFNAFRHWARYLGFATGESGAFLIDPTAAVRDTLPLIFGGEKELSSHEFLRSLSTHLPVFDTGIFREEVENSLNPSVWRRPSEGHLSMSLSLALRRLDLNSTIKLAGKADAGGSFRLTGRNYRTWIGFESVVWNRGRA